jgi:sialate O-acetylesterase
MYSTVPARGIAFLLALLLAPAARADVKLPALFGDHMVLQRDKVVPVWGWADAGEMITVSCAGQTGKTTADRMGTWSVKLDRLTTGGPHTLTVKGKNTLTIRDVLIGEVWLASGQSNMAMTVQRARDFDKEKAAARLPQIRMFTVRSGPAQTPQKDCQGQWAICSPETVGTFSATAYFFGRELHRALGVPVGLINSSVGGTAIEAWTSMPAQRNVKDLAPIFERWDRAAATFNLAQAKARYEKQLAAWKEAAKKARADGKKPPRRPAQPVEPRADRNHPANLFNGKIAPLIPFAIRGALWYQGEANSRPGTSHLYKVQLPLLIRDWRSRWGEGDFPFAWVQLPNFEGRGREWPIVREGMLQTLKLPHTGMAITIDIGDPKNIHPTNKQDVGKRLGLWALATVYDKDVPASGPLPAGSEVKNGEISIRFTHADGGLIAKGGMLKGFVMAGEDHRWHPATARIEGDRVVVSSTEVKNPLAVRYAWENNPTATLFNKAGLPASPFRTDNWKE